MSYPQANSFGYFRGIPLPPQPLQEGQLDTSFILPEFSQRPQMAMPTPESLRPLSDPSQMPPQMSQQPQLPPQAQSPIQQVPQALKRGGKFGDLLTSLLGTMNIRVPVGDSYIGFSGAPIANIIAAKREQARQNTLAGVNEQFLRQGGVQGPSGIGYLSNEQLNTGINAQQGVHARDFLQNNSNFNVPEGTMNSAMVGSIFNQYQQDRSADNRVGLTAQADMQKEAYKQQLLQQAAAEDSAALPAIVKFIQTGDPAALAGTRLSGDTLKGLLTAFTSVTNNREDNQALEGVRSAQVNYLNQGSPLRQAQTELTQAKVESEQNPQAKPKSAGAVDAMMESKTLYGLDPKSAQGKAYAKNRVAGMGPDEAYASATAPVAAKGAGGIPSEIQALEQTKPGAAARFKALPSNEQQRVLERLRNTGR